MDLNFNFGEHFYEGGGSFWMSLLFTFLGAFLGFIFALYINRIIENHGKLDYKEKKHKKDIERLRYLTILLKSAVHTAKTQGNNYFNISESIKQNPLEQHSPRLLATYDIWRLRNIDSIELFDSYSNIVNDGNNIFNNYKDIFGHGDFLFEQLTEARKENERHRMFQNKDESFVRDCIEELYLKIGLRIVNYEKNYGVNAKKIPEYAYLKNMEAVYKTVAFESFDFQKMKDVYLKPLHDTVLHKVDDPNFADLLFEVVKKSLNRLRNIEANSLMFSENMAEIKDVTKEAIEYLKGQIDIITEKIEL